MRRSLVFILPALLASVLLAPGVARAEVIDFDPRSDPVPEILVPAELERYDRLRSAAGRPSIQSPASPDGNYVFVSGVGLPGVAFLDVDRGTFDAFPLEVWNPALVQRASSFAWTERATAVLLTCNRDRPSGPCEPARTTVDVAAGTLESQPISFGTLEGKRVVPLTGYRLLRTAGGTLHIPAYTLEEGASLLQLETPGYDARTPEAVEEHLALGLDAPERLMLTTDELLLLVSLEDGSLTTVGPLPAGTSLSTAITSLDIRPGTDTASYVLAPEITCAGTRQRGRECRGGGMPTSYWLVQESLGRIPEARNRYVTETSLQLVDLSTGERREIANADHTPGRFAGTSWSADGSLLLVTLGLPSRLEGREHPVYASSAGPVFDLFAPDGTFQRRWQHPVLDAPGLALQAAEGTRFLASRPWDTGRQLYLLDAAAPDEPAVPVFTGHGYVFSWALAGRALAYVHGDVTDPGEMYLAETQDVAGTARALTDLNAGLRQTSDINFEPIRYTTSAGYELEGIYVYPGDWPFPPPEPKPVVVWQQGGPGGQITNSWGTTVESPYSLLPNFGLPVFLVNGSGRVSNGRQFYSDMADGRNFGQRDILDVKEGVERLIALGVADPAAVGVTGCSYGGYFTLQSMAEFPDLYAAGNAQCSLNDLLWEYHFGWAHTIAYLMGGTPAGAWQDYFRASPTYRAGSIRAPLLVFHGTNDFLPFEHMTNVHDQVEMNGVPARFLRALGEGHGFGAAATQRYAMQLQLDWFRRHLTPGGAAALQLAPRAVVPALPWPSTWEVLP